MAHDVFISHSAKDKALGDAICARLEAAGIRCWIAPRDILPGVEWSEAIIDGIAQSRVMILVFSKHSNASPQILREVTLAVDRGAAVIPFRIDDVPPRKALEYYISTPHWLDAYTPPIEQHVERLVPTIQRLLTHLGRTDGASGPGEEFPAELRRRFTDPHLLADLGFARDLQVHDQEHSKDVLLRVFLPPRLPGLDAEGFRSAMEAVQALENPAVVRPLEYAAARDLWYAVLPRPKGETLQSVIRRSERLPVTEVLNILQRIAGALQSSHDRGVVHGALSSSCVHLSEGAIELRDLDLGRLSVRIPGGKATDVLPRSCFAYLDPERLARGGEPTVAGDVYALSCLAYEMLSGEPPFTGETAQDVLASRVMGPSLDLRDLKSPIPAGAESVLLRALATRPTERYATVGGFVEALARACSRDRVDVLRVSGAPETLEVGESTRLVVEGRNGWGELIDVDELTLATDDSALVEVDSGSLMVTAVGAGRAQIRAESPEASARVTLTVVPARAAAVEIGDVAETILAGDRVQLTASVVDRRGSPLSRPVRWISSNPLVASIDQAGVLTAEREGAVVLTAEIEGKRAELPVTVEAAEVSRVEIDPLSQPLYPNETVHLRAMAFDARGVALTGRPVQWRCEDPRIAVVTDGGEIKGRTAGETALIARIGEREASVQIRVEPTPAAAATVRVPTARARGMAYAGAAVIAILATAGWFMSSQTAPETAGGMSEADSSAALAAANPVPQMPVIALTENSGGSSFVAAHDPRPPSQLRKTEQPIGTKESVQPTTAEADQRPAGPQKSEPQSVVAEPSVTDLEVVNGAIVEGRIFHRRGEYMDAIAAFASARVAQRELVGRFPESDAVRVLGDQIDSLLTAARGACETELRLTGTGRTTQCG